MISMLRLIKQTDRHGKHVEAYQMDRLSRHGKHVEAYPNDTHVESYQRISMLKFRHGKHV
jgi:hypothetical protein